MGRITEVTPGALAPLMTAPVCGRALWLLFPAQVLGCSCMGKMRKMVQGAGVLLTLQVCVCSFGWCKEPGTSLSRTRTSV